VAKRVIEDAAAIVANYEYRWQYSNRYTYHPFHAMSMISGGSILGLWTSAVMCRNYEQVRRLTAGCPHPYPHRFCVTSGATDTEVFA